MTEQVLIDLIRIPSTRGHEGPAIQYMHDALLSLVDTCHLVRIEDSIMEDPDYAFRLPGHSYADTPNLECIVRGSGGGSPIVFNTHLDVVPPSEGQEHAFDPRVEHGVVFGRGACDAKGQAATLFAMISLLRERGVLPLSDLLFHFVIEEECGGNGTLAMIRRGVKAAAAVVCEPSELAVVPAARGAVWFHLRALGKGGHSGSKASTISALKKAIDAIEIIERYHDRLLMASRGHPLFDRYQDPMPVTFGVCSAGEWPATVPSEATVKGVFGFLPNRSRHQVQRELKQAIVTEGDEWLQRHCEITFPMLNSDGFSLSEDHPLVTTLVKAVRRSGAPGKVRAMTASSDAWLYNNKAGIPTVLFGPGSIAHAHSALEQICMDDIMTAASALVEFVQHFGSTEGNYGSGTR